MLSLIVIWNSLQLMHQIEKKLMYSSKTYNRKRWCFTSSKVEELRSSSRK